MEKGNTYQTNVPFVTRQVAPVEPPVGAVSALTIEPGEIIIDPTGATISTSTYAPNSTVDTHIYAKVVGAPNLTFGADNTAIVHDKQEDNLQFWREHLAKCPDSKFVSDVMKDLEIGVDIGYIGEITRVEMKNWPLTEKYRDNVDRFISEQVAAGSIEGPYSLDSSKVYRTSLLGAFEKTAVVRYASFMI